MKMRFLGTLFLAILVAACAQTEAPESSDMSAEAAPAPEITWEDSSDAASDEAAEAMETDPASLPDEYTVFFSFNSPVLTPEAEAVIDQAVAAAVAKGKVGFTVTGFSDSAGSKRQNDTMSRWRALAVADELIFRGVSESAIETSWKGDAEAMSTGDNPEQADRRVVIQLL